MEAEACVNCHEGPVPTAVLNRDERSRIFLNETGERILGTIQVIPNREGCQGAGCHAPLDSLPILGVLDIAARFRAVGRFGAAH